MGKLSELLSESQSSFFLSFPRFAFLSIYMYPRRRLEEGGEEVNESQKERERELELEGGGQQLAPRGEAKSLSLFSPSPALSRNRNGGTQTDDDRRPKLNRTELKAFRSIYLCLGFFLFSCVTRNVTTPMLK